MIIFLIWRKIRKFVENIEFFLENPNPKIKRQIEILGLCLLNKDKARLTIYDICDIFGIEYITVRRDFKDIRFWGVDIHTSKHGIRIYGEPSAEKLREIMLYYVGLCYSANIFDKATSLLIEKLGTDSLKFMVMLQVCIDKGLKAIITYEKNKDSVEKRTVSPIMIFHSNKSWRLLSQENDSVKQFHLGKITSVEPTKEEFKKMDEGEFEDLFKYSWYSWIGNEKHEVKLNLSAEWVERIRDTVMMEGQVLEVNDDGTGVFNFTVNRLGEIAAWIAGRGEGVRVLEPAELKDMVIDLAKGSLRNYELQKFGKEMNYTELAHKLINEQRIEWDACGAGYASLETVKVKTYDFPGYSIKVQFNPGRMTSTSAKVDPKSIKERKCFLCYDNLPPQQRGVEWKEDYLILVNPFPIFPEHFTVPSRRHLPQQVKDSFPMLNELAFDLKERYIAFYNGPKCGASAPDHIHFQAGLRDFMPIDHEYGEIRDRYGKVIYSGEGAKVFALDDGLRKFISIESGSLPILTRVFCAFLETYSDHGGGDEPMLNILSNYVDDEWRVIIFLRGKHRPAAFFAENEGKILLSPASVDIGGVCIVPREEDFDKITRENLTGIFHEVFISGEELEEIAEKLRKKLA